jgi:cell wall-associated NlpC family hydrolase
MRWHEQYLGKPWTHIPDPPNSFNCGELLRHIYKTHLGHDAPPLLADTQDVRSCIRDVGNIGRYASFRRVDRPQDFDVAVMSRGGPADHVGLYCGGNILHCRPRVGVFLDDVFTLQSFGWRKIAWLRAEGLRRCG